MSFFVDEGDAIPLSLFLDQGETNKYVQAQLFNENGTALATVNLTHKGNGLYTSTAQLMPANHVFATYRVYDDGNYQIENLDYEPTSESFQVPLAKPPKEINEITMTIESETNSLEMVVGNQSNEIIMEIEK
jgi:hypothetical protein